MTEYRQGITIVIPLYNTEGYIEECLASVFAQSYVSSGLALSVLCVDDGSTDRSAELASQMFDFSGSIDCRLIRHSENRGLAAARNTGFREVQTRYVMFLDSDDLLRPNTLQELHDVMEANGSDVGIFEYQHFSPSGTRWPRNYSSRLFTGQTYVVDAPAQNLGVIHALSACNKIYLTSSISSLQFPEHRSYAEDVEFWFEVLANKPKLIIIAGLATYLYRKREDAGNSSIMDMGGGVNNHLVYIDILESLEARHKSGNQELYRSLVWFSQKSLFYYLSRFGLSNSSNQRESAADYFSRARALISKNRIDARLPAYQRVLYRLLQSGFWRCALCIDPVYRIKLLGAGVVKKSQVLNTDFISRCYAFFSMQYLYELPKLIRYLFCARAADNDPGVWLFGERGSDASDNGFALFRHAYKDPNSAIKPYYVCSGTCFSELQNKYNNILLYGSDNHQEVFRKAGTLVSSHSRGNIEPYKNKYLLSLCSSNYRNKKYVFLGHGITKDDMRGMLGKGNRFNARFDLLWCASKIEYRDVVARYGYESSSVKLAPLPRWSWPMQYVEPKQLGLSAVKNVLVMFTWRSVFGRSHRGDESIKRRFECEYLTPIKNLLENAKLQELSGLGDVGIHLVLHPEIEITLERYGLALPELEFIRVHPSHHISDLIKGCDVLVTDYSSITFDFAFYNKPTVYYQFDQQSVRANHYQKGYFDYEIHGFGSVCVDPQSCIERLTEYLDNPPDCLEVRRHIHYQHPVSPHRLSRGFDEVGLLEL